METREPKVHSVTEGDIERLRNELRTRGWAIVQSDVERPVGDVLDDSANVIGAPLVVVGVPTAAEVAAFFPNSGRPKRPGPFQYKVVTD